MYFRLPASRYSRHPVMRAVSLLIGIVLIGVLLMFGLVVASVLLLGGGVLLAWRQWQRGRAHAAQAVSRTIHKPQVLEGEFVVVRQDRPVTH